MAAVDTAAVDTAAVMTKAVMAAADTVEADMEAKADTAEGAAMIKAVTAVVDMETKADMAEGVVMIKAAMAAGDMETKADTVVEDMIKAAMAEAAIIMDLTANMDLLSTCNSKSYLLRVTLTIEQQRTQEP